MSKGQEQINLAQIRKAIPESLFKKSESRFLVSVAQAISTTALLAYIGYRFIPLTWYALPIWIVFDFLLGTVAMGIWVLGHECGHSAFSDNKLWNDILGYFLHEILLVPYFSWQHSHALHHAKTNHLTEGETFCPVVLNSKMGKIYQKTKDIIGIESFSIVQIFNVTVLGWPLYLLLGVTGGPSRGFTSHFIVPNKLFPSRMLLKVSLSNIGLCFVIFGLYKWAQATSFAEVMALYIGPYLVVNMWLTIITFLQHTDINVPHYDSTSWNWLKGALSTIDRNYPAWIDSLHFEIGTTHVLHHVFSELPHYNANEANLYFKKAIGDLYHSDEKPLLTSLYQSASLVGVEHKGDGVWFYSKE
ncbi:unnamed protein product [Paramecium pentaurelia]|uniref:Fatty acid desaturase domain-containing protein n=1 Tax=Paramecium pentaurelia TaxID=43138 RepID=A0A8S1SR83_9CILI|nr:unnamed protein product [Paramecium pentaurelia]